MGTFVSSHPSFARKWPLHPEKRVGAYWWNKSIRFLRARLVSVKLARVIPILLIQLGARINTSLKLLLRNVKAGDILPRPRLNGP